jgi:hypothetical protein
MAKKFAVEVSFDLSTQIEPEINDYNWDSSEVTDFEGNSYFSGGDLTVSGGGFTFVVSDDGFEDEEDAKSWVEQNIIDEGNEVQDNNGITWIVENLDISVEAQETELPSLEEALATLGEFAESRREDEEWGEIARSAVVVIDAFGSLTARVSSLETQVATLVAKAEEDTHPF